MTVNRPLPKDLGRLSLDKTIPIALARLVGDGDSPLVVTQTTASTVSFLFYTDRDLVIDEVTLITGAVTIDNDVNSSSGVVTAALRTRDASFGTTAITNFSALAGWTNVVASASMGGSSISGIANKAVQIIGPSSEPVFVPANTFLGLSLADNWPINAFPFLHSAVLQVKGYYPKSGNA